MGVAYFGHHGVCARGQARKGEGFPLAWLGITLRVILHVQSQPFNRICRVSIDVKTGKDECIFVSGNARVPPSAVHQVWLRWVLDPLLCIAVEQVGQVLQPVRRVATRQENKLLLDQANGEVDQVLVKRQ